VGGWAAGPAKSGQATLGNTAQYEMEWGGKATHIA